MTTSSSLSMPAFFFLCIFFLLCSVRCTEARSGPYTYPITKLISEDLYRRVFLHKDDDACPAKGFYTYDAFIAATGFFPTFASEGCLETNKRELAAFLAQISHENTGGGQVTAPDGPYTWGLCYKEKINPVGNYCDSAATQWPCYQNKSYKGRGAIELTGNYNYGPAGKALGFDGLKEPELVASQPDLAFKTALWFWMTPAGEKPSCHDVMVGRFKPSMVDLESNRTAGFGLVTNIINGGFECGKPENPQVNDRIGYYKRYCQMFNVDVGQNLDCANQKSY